ncbi:phosphodiester glycosidase family protein [Candidatus Berkiella aquae]|uniref:Phosphodiester glycosidase family protein n=1 Tax=Candidatus Berkiella aquae TaxID=295108 RepID=A0A0Q9YXA9_9GAMM|nr:phosphodiester glycosidase family protein [Candidatus Berkiella aquae]MCS5710849.1 phosphodiester glycosidase family protein [Candidatus Berkiella aquae]
MKKIQLCLNLLFISVITPCYAKTLLPEHQFLQIQGHEIHLLSFDPDSVEIIQVKSPDNRRRSVTEFVKEHHAYAGINGGYFAISDNGEGSAVGALKIRGEWINFPIQKRGAIGWNKVEQKPYFDRLITKNRQTQPVVVPEFDTGPTARKRWQQFDYVVGGIPLLMKNSKPIVDYRQEQMITSFSEERHARTAVCLKKDGKWLWLVASHTKKPDRPQVSKIIEGLTLRELTDILLKQGCVDAINLDGGGSSTLVIDGKIINQPAGDFNPLFRSYEERPVYDAMLLIPKG